MSCIGWWMSVMCRHRSGVGRARADDGPMRMTARRSVVPDPCAAFAVLRATGVLVCGPSDAILATMRALTRVGVGRIAVPGTGAGVPAGIGAAVVVVRADE